MQPRGNRAYFRVGGVASNPNLIPLNPPSKGGLLIRFPPFSRGARGDHHSSPPNLRYARGNHPYGDRFVATIQIDTPKGRSQPIATIWLVQFNEDIARFITAIPVHK